MLSPISSSTTAGAVSLPQTSAASSQNASQAAAPQDSVHLSAQAKAAIGGGDVDQDGDSH